MLKKMEPHMDKSHGVQVAAWAAILVAFFLMLRRSNLVPHHATQFHADEQFVRNDLIFFKNMALLNLKWSKTRQEGQRVTMPLLKGPGRIDPMRALRHMLSLTPGTSPRDPLFLFPRVNKPGQPPQNAETGYSVLTSGSVQFYLKDWLEKVGYRPQDYTLHGLRRGGATHAYNR